MIVKDTFFDENKNCTFENDKLNRKDIAINLTHILRHSEINSQGLILALNAQWGNGKTTFIKMWKNMLDKDCKIPNLYFSAWEEDYTKEPLISLLGELNQYLKENKVKNKEFNQAIGSVQKILKEHYLLY
ncbi:P-loop NTPase fold protein [Helicobacter sp. MIT 21-1697]|uniref:P-loop NTPase fold protein n=1 Tax=Helicobacter sp. MIT 21-1697 TaxID=2993733 RepID=UPI00224B2400|nr:P-loop NTPase fold protein [Helicobacter sp. MIT 21-1697]MCX2717396.1 P-loop NTPase fold protein [Helicobacter sp. MIT 21-1697]